MRRREFLLYGSSVLFGQKVKPNGDLEDRLAKVIQAYDAQGNHRTGTAVDNASGEWLAGQVREYGVSASLEPFALSRVDPLSCHLEARGRRIDGVPLFDAAFTGAEGVQGKLGLLGSDAEIGLTESQPFQLNESAKEQQDQVREARHSKHKAIVVVTRGERPGLYLLNASDFRKPFGPPMLQVSNAEGEWLRQLAAARAEAKLVAHVNRTAVRAYNVTARIAGSKPALAPLVFVAPRSAWWQCVSEQGSRLACWLEVIRTIGAGKPARDCFFVAPSGHELGFLGIDPYITRHAGLIKRAYAWIFFGSGMGGPRQPNLIHASDDELEQWTVTAMGKAGLSVDGKARHDSVARGEIRAVQQGGGRFVTIACDSEVYHSVADRWPEAIDIGLLSRYARAFTEGGLRLAGG